jgi:Flp pilus assembly protein TadG
MNRLLKSQSGSVIIAMTLFLMLLLCFLAFGTEAGRWYLLRAEISKAVDAGALVGAKNISNPYVDPKTLAEEICAENFPAGAFGTPSSGNGSAVFAVDVQDGNRVFVTGRATSPAIMAQLLGINEVPVSSGGAAQMRPVEIVLVLDRSGSMTGRPMSDLKVAAKSFVDFFNDSQASDKMGLVSFATNVKVERPLGNNFVTPIKTAITAMQPVGWTNAEDAIAQADGPSGFTDQNGVPQADRIQQFLVFFSDGRPNVFRDVFRNRNAIVDALVRVGGGNCDPGDNNQVYQYLMSPVTGNDMTTVVARPTGDGLLPSRCGANVVTTRWFVLDQDPVPGYQPDACNIPQATLHNHLCSLAADLATANAQKLKDQGVTVFSIGLGAKINTDFLESLASSPEQVYMAPTSAELQAIFQKVAQDIKLRLVL